MDGSSEILQGPVLEYRDTQISVPSATDSVFSVFSVDAGHLAGGAQPVSLMGQASSVPHSAGGNCVEEQDVSISELCQRRPVP